LDNSFDALFYTDAHFVEHVDENAVQKMSNTFHAMPFAPMMHSLTFVPAGQVTFMPQW
jgi:hypothetical protein